MPVQRGPMMVQDNVTHGEESTENAAEQVNDTEMEETDGGGGEDLSAESSNVVEAAETVLEEGMGSKLGNENEIFIPSTKRKRAKLSMERARTSNDKCDDSEQSAVDNYFFFCYQQFFIFYFFTCNVMYVQGTHSDRINAIDWKREWEGEVLLTHMSF